MEKINKFTIITVLYITLLIISNLMASKIINIGWFIGPAGVIAYPFCFMAGDVLTEVYGYKLAKKVIFLGFFMMFLLTIMTNLGIYLPPSPQWGGQKAYELIFGSVPRITLASFLGYIFGELGNSKSLELIKKLTGQRLLFIRTIGSTVIGQLADSLIFFTVAFYGTLPNDVLVKMIFFQYIIKVIIEAIGGTPLAYLMVDWAKKEYIERNISENRKATR